VIFRGANGRSSLLLVPLEASASAACAAAGGWLPAACKHSVLQELAPETVLPSCFSPGEA